MFFWFLGLSLLAVSLVFDSPALDHRFVLAGSVLPLVELVSGRALVLHTLAGSVLILVGVMVVLRGRRLAQRRWVGLAIGTFLHLVFDGAWADTSLFWWPAFGVEFADTAPEFGRWPFVVGMEVVGLVALVVAFRRSGVTDRADLVAFARTGRLAA